MRRRCDWTCFDIDENSASSLLFASNPKPTAKELAPMEHTTLDLRQGSSDKTYQFSIEPKGGGYVVPFQNGRRGRALNPAPQPKHPSPTTRPGRTMINFGPVRSQKDACPSRTARPTSGPTTRIAPTASFSCCAVRSRQTKSNGSLPIRHGGCPKNLMSAAS